MIRTLILSGAMLAALAAGGCTWTYENASEPRDTSPMGELERAERNRQSRGRVHPDCRADQGREKDQPEGCEILRERDR